VDPKVQVSIEAVNRARSELNQLERELQDIQGAGTKTGEVFSLMGKHFLAFTAAAGGIAGVTSLLKSFVTEAAEAEQIENRLRFALEGLGYAWAELKPHVDKYAQSVQEMTRFSDEEARKALTDMLLYTRDFAKAQDGARLAMDMSVRTGQDLGSTTRYIGMAMNGNVEILGRFIPELRELDDKLGKNATAADKAAYALKILQDKFGGTAQADMDTYAGKVKAFENSWSDLKETLGNELLPVLKNLFDNLKDITDQMNKFLTGGTAQQQMADAVKRWVEARRNIAGAEKELREMDAVGKFFGAERTYKDEIEFWTRQMKEAEEKIKRLQGVMEKESKPVKSLKDIPLPDAGRAAEEEKRLLANLKLLESQVQEEDTLASVLAAQASLEKQKADEKERELKTTELILKNSEIITEEDQKAAVAAAREAEERERIRDIKSEELILQADLNRMVDEEQPMEAARAAQESRERNRDLIQIKETYNVNFETAQQIKDLWDGVAMNMSTAMQAGFFDLYKNGLTDLGKVFEDFCANMINSWYRALAQMAANAIMFGNISGYQGPGGTGGLMGLLINAFAGGGGGPGTNPGSEYNISTWHEGGTVPNFKNYRWIPRFHSGLGPDEFPAILQAGERVLSRKEVAGGLGSAPEININIENRTGYPVKARQSEMRFDGKKYVRNVMLELAQEDMTVRGAYGLGG